MMVQTLDISSYMIEDNILYIYSILECFILNKIEGDLKLQILHIHFIFYSTAPLIIRGLQ